VRKFPHFTPNHANRNAYMTDALHHPSLSSNQDSPSSSVFCDETAEGYVPTPRRGFAGSGSRLGGVVSEPATQQQVGMSGAYPHLVHHHRPQSLRLQPRQLLRGLVTQRPSPITPRFSVDQSKPTTSVQVGLADGTRLFVLLSVLLCSPWQPCEGPSL
jgi:hypothetical protein